MGKMGYINCEPLYSKLSGLICWHKKRKINSPLDTITDSLSQSMLAAGFACTLHLSLKSVSILANCARGASTHVIPTENNDSYF